MVAPNTTDIVVNFLTTYVKQRGHSDWRPPKLTSGRKRSRQQQQQQQQQQSDDVEQVERICQSLNEISNDLQEFIERAQNERFKEMMNSIETNNPSYEEFTILADELFSEGISWFKIVTLLVFCGELACRAINVQNEEQNDSDNDDQDDSAGDDGVEEDKPKGDEHENVMVHEIINCITKYMEENLLQWINEQDEGWLSVRHYTINGNSNNTKGMKHYFRMATFAAFVGGLYFCSKFILQK